MFDNISRRKIFLEQNITETCEKNARDWKEVLPEIKRHKSDLSEWNNSLLNDNSNIDKERKKIEEKTMERLLEMDVEDVKRMTESYCRGDDETLLLEREVMYHLFISVVRNYHNLW